MLFAIKTCSIAMTSLPNCLIFFIMCSVIQIKESTTDVSVPSKSSLVELKSSQDADGVHSNTVDIHVGMESSISPLTIKSLIREELQSFIKEYNNSVLDKIEDKKSVSTQCMKYDSADSNLTKMIEHFNINLRTIENIVKDIQADNKKSSFNADGGQICPRKEPSLGVTCNSCSMFPKSQKNLPKSCKEILKGGNNVTGIYEIFPKHAEESFPVLCDMEIKGGGWAHFQKRFDGSQDFYLGWRDYKFGFGNFDGEFWLGLQKTYLLSGFEPTELLVEIVDRDNVSAFAHYTSFAIGPESGGYKLDRVSGFSGDAGDSLTYHVGSKFSATDLDFSSIECIPKTLGPYWHNSCFHSNLNGKYINIDLPEKFKYQGLHWKTFRNLNYSHAKSRMLVRPLN